MKILSALSDTLIRWSNSVFLEDIFPQEFIEDAMLIRGDGNITVGFDVKFPESGSLSSEEILTLERKLEDVFSRLPEGTAIHHQSIYFHSQKSIKAHETSMQYISSRIAEYHGSSPILESKSYLYLCFRFKAKTATGPLSTFFSTASSAFRNPLEGLNQNKALTSNYTQSFLQNAKVLSGFEFKRMENKDLAKARVNFMNLDFSGESNTVNNEILTGPDKVKVGNNTLQFVYLGRTAHQLYQVHSNERGLPSFMPWPMGTYLNFPHVINHTMIIGGEKDLRRLDEIKRMRKSLGKSQTQVDREIIDEIEGFTTEIRSKNKAIVQFNHNVMVWDSNSDLVSVRTDMVKSAYIRMNGSYGITTAYNAGNYFFVTSPGYALDTFNTLRMSMEDALLHYDFTSPVASEMKGIILCNREQEPVLVDFESPILPNRNQVAIGPSGSGKSFLFNTLISQQIEQNTDVIIIDVGDAAGSSYQNILAFYKGDYKRFSDKNPFRANPFLIGKNKQGLFELSTEKKIFLLSLLTIIWKESDQKMSKEEEAIFSDLLIFYYKKVNEKNEIPRLDRFVAFINDYITKATNQEEFNYFDLKSFNLVIKKFIGNGSYASVLNGETAAELSENRLICFDLFGIKSDPVLFPIVSVLIIETINDKIRSGNTKKKRVYIDEAWSILSGSLGEFINVGYRTIRKSNGGITIISQGIVEIADSSIGEVIRQNSASVLLLNHNSVPSSVPVVQKFFALTDHTIDLIKSLRVGDTWREFLLIRSGFPQVFSVNVGPHASAAFSTRPEDRNEIEALTVKGGPEYAINQFVENNS